MQHWPDPAPMVVKRSTTRKERPAPEVGGTLSLTRRGETCFFGGDVDILLCIYLKSLTLSIPARRERDRTTAHGQNANAKEVGNKGPCSGGGGDDGGFVHMVIIPPFYGPNGKFVAGGTLRSS